MKFDDSVNLLDIKVNRDKNHDRKIVFSEDIGVTMRYPNLRDAQELDKAGTDSDRVKLIAKCTKVFLQKSQYTIEQNTLIRSLKNSLKDSLLSFLQNSRTSLPRFQT